MVASGATELLALPYDCLVNVLRQESIGPLELCRLESSCTQLARLVDNAVWQSAFLHLRRENALGPPESWKAEFARRETWGRSWRQNTPSSTSPSKARSEKSRSVLVGNHTQKLRRLALKIIPSSCGSPPQQVDAHFVDPARVDYGCFATIGAACACANPFDVILIAPGVYNERLDLDKSLDIVGVGKIGTVVVTGLDGPVIQVACKVACRVANLSIRQQAGETNAPMTGAVRVEGGGVLVLEESTISSDAGHCVVVKGADTYAYVLHNAVQHAKGVGVLVCDHAKAMIEDNEISENKRAGIAILTGGDPVVRQNKIHNGHDSGVLVSEKGRGRIEQNDIFCNMRAGVAILKEGTPVVTQNRIYDGRDSGVLVCENGRGSVVDNVIYSNQMAGVAIGHGGASQVKGNTIRDGSGGVAPLPLHALQGTHQVKHHRPAPADHAADPAGAAARGPVAEPHP